MLALFVLATIAMLAMALYAILRGTRRGRPGDRPTFDWPSAGPAETMDCSLNDFVGGLATGSILGGVPENVVGGMAGGGQRESPPAPHHFPQAEANQPSAFGGFEAAAQHDHGATFGHGGGFDPSPSFDAANGCAGGASFDCGTSFDSGCS